ncbi:MAG: 4-hydroxy-tetrahydrodipicolinate synthase [Pseudomonadota bacterium]
MIKGSVAALVTPMTADGMLELDRLAGLVERQVAGGSAGVVVGGTTGESASLSGGELAELVAEAARAAAGRLTVIAGTGSNDTRRAVALTRRAFAAGADACLVVTPSYNKPEQHGLEAHFSAVAEAATGPVLLYNVPGRTACDLQPETVARLRRVANIVGIKEATGSTARARRLRELCGDDFLILSGDDPTFVGLIDGAGATGIVSVTANVAPREMAEVCRLALAGDVAAARALNERLMPLHKALFVESNPIPVKWLLAEQGQIGSGLRLPLTPLRARHAETVADAYRAAVAAPATTGMLEA